MNLNSTVSQEFDSSNTSSKAFDSSNSATAQIFDGSNTLTSYRLDLDNNAVATGTVSSISTYNPTTNQITVAHTTENFVGLSVGAPLYHNVVTAGGYFASNPRGVVFLKSLDTSNVNGSIFTVSQVPNGSVIPVPNALTGTFQIANEARLFAGNNINTATETTVTLVEESEKTFNGTNTGGQFLNNCSFSGSNVTAVSGSGVADLDLYQGMMVRYTTTGTPPTINAGGDTTNGGSTTSLVNNRTYFIEGFFQVGSSTTYVVTLKEYPTSSSIINFTSTGSGTHVFTAIGIATDKDIFHIKNNGYVVGDMVRYTYPSGGHFGVTTEATELKDYYFIERLFGSHNFQVNFTIGELTPKLQEFIGLTATQSSVTTTVTASGFTAPLTYSITSGTLPAGLSLNTSTGIITGTPSAAYSQSTVRLTVVDAAASTDFIDITFQVNPAPNLYSFTSATFTTGGADSYGPQSLSQARSGVGSPSWQNYITMPGKSGYIVWQVPQSATYRITANGAGHASGYAGASMRGDFSLNQGEYLVMVLGQRGVNSGASGGSGGTFVGRGTDFNDSNLLLAAGGSSGYGGSGGADSRTHGQTGTSGSNGYCCSGGSNGQGGGSGTTNTGWGAGGGGYFSDGVSGGSYGGPGGQSIRNSSAYGSYQGPFQCAGGGSYGGFGGGGGGGCNGAGGGGGYSGGGTGGGGGGSYNVGSNQSNVGASNSGTGTVVIQRL